MTTAPPERYERSPDGATWPGTLKGLLKALDDTIMKSFQLPGQEFTISTIRAGHAEPIRIYQNGVQQ